MKVKNAILDRLPRHLFQLVIDQPFNSYTWQDHSVWRYVMRQNVAFLAKHAHHSYLNGLEKTGIGLEQIPDLETMNRILSKIGWAAVTVDGFIPPAAFMEFQAYNVLVIAADIRPIDQIEYTPAPDIIHEAAGHAPIISDPEYAAYLKYFGEIGSKAFSSSADYLLYEAIRHLSILKADPTTPAAEIASAEATLSQRESELGMPSEMALIRNLHWWTVEYGLIGTLENPKIYGAGLLSSIGESANALSDRVAKLPYTIDAVYYNFDITKPQPQLFVSPDFAHLTAVLDEFANRMALRKGGIEGVLKAIESENTATCVFSSGLQVSGTFTDYLMAQNQLVYLRTSGPSMLSYGDKVLSGHGKDYHSNGFGSPVGRIKHAIKPPAMLEERDLKAIGIVINQVCDFEFESGIRVRGTLTSVLRKKGKLLLMSFSDCLVTFENQVLFEPAWGTYDMAIGESIHSVYSGPADPNAFGLAYPLPKEKTHKIIYTDLQKELHNLYGQVRKIRDEGNDFDKLGSIWKSIVSCHFGEWLLAIEIMEVISKNQINTPFYGEIRYYLTTLSKQRPEISKCIDRGLSLIS